MSSTPKAIFQNEDFCSLWDILAADIYDASYKHGFHGDPIQDNVPTKLMLVVSELAEAMEAHRKNLRSDHLPNYSGIVEELADAVIRIMDLGYMLSLDIPDAIIAKHEYNKSRDYKHGGKAY